MTREKGDTLTVQELRKELAACHTRPCSSNKPLTISVVPQYCRTMDDSRYTPFHVSIGPYHWKSSELRRETDKISCLKELLDLNDVDPNRLDVLVKDMKQLKDEAEAYYSPDLDLSAGGGMARMLLLDGCYLVYWYGLYVSKQTEDTGLQSLPGQRSTARKICNRIGDFVGIMRSWWSAQGSSSTSDPPSSVPHAGPPTSSSSSTQTSTGSHPGSVSVGSDYENANMYASVRDTWYLLENQIPFMVVEKILMETTRCKKTEVLNGFISYAKDQMQQLSYISRTPASPPREAEKSPSHLLDLLHTFFRPNQDGAGTEINNSNTGTKLGQWRRATEYRRYGNVQFVTRELDGHAALSVLDVCIKGGKLLVPRLRINGDTWTILLNLMALERQHASLGTYVTAYCIFMSQMACTAEDVQLLLDSDVMDDSVGNPKNIASNFAELCRGVVFNVDDAESNYLRTIMHELDNRCRSRRQNLFAWFNMRYWSWKNIPVVLGVISALILLVSGVASAVYAGLTYRDTPKSGP